MTQTSTVLITQVASKVRKSGAATRALKQVLRENPEISREVRQQTAIWSLGIRVFQRRLRFLLEEDLEQTEFDESEPPIDIEGALFHYLIRIQGHSPDRAMVQVGASTAQVRAWIATANSASSRRLDETDTLAVKHSFPRWLTGRFVDDFGQSEAERLMSKSNQAGPISFRTNLALGTRHELAARLAAEGVTTSPGRVGPAALTAHGRPNIRASEAFRAGAYEVQDEASQLVAQACAVTSVDRVWDVCAGRGGKTLALAKAKEVIATDVDAASLRDLGVRLRKTNATNITSRLLPSGDVEQARAFSETAATGFDVVLVDAPCSSLGTLRRSPDLRWTLRAEEIAAGAALQGRLLARAAAGVKPGGALVYATCSVIPEENDGVTRAFLKAHPHFRPSPLQGAWGVAQSRRLGISESAHTVNLTPQDHGTDGFFIARFVNARPLTNP